MKRFALIGNPNCGKTTLFNALTGATAYVGNWPGVTVEQRKGTYKKKNIGEAEIIDLPGIYSLSPYTPEEVISRNFILDENPDLVINVIDATNLERNLYMTTQVLEMDVPVVIALNMMDAVSKQGVEIDVEKLSKELGVPVVPISALRNRGIEDLMKKALEVCETPRKGCSVIFGDEGKAIQKAQEVYEKAGVKNSLFHAIKALEGDELEEKTNGDVYLDARKESGLTEDDEFEVKSADLRYQYITAHYSPVRSGVPMEAKEKLSISDKIDKVLTNRWAGLPIFLAVILIVFALTFSEDLFFLRRGGVFFEHSSFEGTLFEGMIWTATEVDPDTGKYIAGGINSPGVILANFVNSFNGVGDLPAGYTGWGGIARSIEQLFAEVWHSPEWLVGLVNAIFADGFFAVIGFLPQIVVLFLFFSILEDSGYMARVAFIFDRIFRGVGLSGRAFIPMLMGYGCGVPAMINTRTLNTDKERIKTIRVISFFTCGAKATMLSAVAGVMASHFKINAVAISYFFYIFSIVLAVAAVVLMHWTTQREKVPPFVMELPSYHAPRFKSLMIHVWDKSKHYIKKAATIIILAAIVIWFGTHFSWSWQFVDPEVVGYPTTILGGISAFISPLFAPMGFGIQLGADYAWAYSLASVTGLVAKEIVPETLEVIGGMSGGTFDTFVVQSGITTGGFMAFIMFNMTTIPCFASVGTATGELPKGKLKWTILFWLCTSYVLGILTFLIVDYVWTLAIFIPAIIGVYVGAYFYNKKKTLQEQAAE